MKLEYTCANKQACQVGLLLFKNGVLFMFGSKKIIAALQREREIEIDR
jgi:hypothetical protein